MMTLATDNICLKRDSQGVIIQEFGLYEKGSLLIRNEDIPDLVKFLVDQIYYYKEDGA